ncbi:MAG: hypothetical protein ACJAXH_001772 [Colwellia sp.]|jgi:hypothetical protein
MRLTIYSSKGGVGKTPLSILFAVDKGFAVGCNESTDIYSGYLDEDMYLLHELDEEFPLIPDDIDIVFDMAGTLSKYDHALVSAIRQSDIVIVPIWNNVNSIKLGKNTIRAIADISKRIIVVATKLERTAKERGISWEETADFRAVNEAVADVNPSIRVLPLKFSKVYDRICKEFTSFHKLSEASAMFKSGQKEMLIQIEDIYKEVGCHV